MEKHDEWVVNGAHEVGLEHNLFSEQEEAEEEAYAVKLEQVTPHAHASRSCRLFPGTFCFNLSRLCYGVCCAEHLPRHHQCSCAKGRHRSGQGSLQRDPQAQGGGPASLSKEKHPVSHQPGFAAAYHAGGGQ